LFVNAHSGQRKPNLRRKRKALRPSVLESLLEIVGVEVMAEGVRVGTHSQGCMPICLDRGREFQVLDAATIYS